MLNTLAYKKFQVVFFAVLLILFVVPCMQFEMAGIMTATTRTILGAMIALLAYGLIRSIISLKPIHRVERVERVEFAKADVAEV